MQLRDIVEINQQGLVADAVNLAMMADAGKNLRLCEGFVFNYDDKEPKFSTLGVLDALRESFHSTSNPNIHLMVQDFGKGKSHFALTVANFFKKPTGSPEVEGILNQIGFAVSGRAQAIHERLRAYKARSKAHLVLCISGEVQADLGRMLLQSIRSALEEHGIGDAIAQHLIEKPLTYLKQLSGEKREQAEQYLEEIGQPHGDLDTMTELLAEDNYDIIPIVVDISDRVEGFAYNFEYNLDIEKILEDVIRKLCTGKERQFEGVLILFDELNAYLRTWLKNPKAAGNYALQGITNVCGRNQGKIALLCLAQVQPTLDRDLPELERGRYKRFTSRIELAPSTYEPRASLELVIDNLIRQKSDAQWQAFHDRWSSVLTGEARTTYERYITAYTDRKFDFQKFFQHLGLGCYPLHPLTAYLLCNLDFTQGRTVIQFIKEDVARFIETMPTEVNGQLQFVRPVRLLDAFKSNFAQMSAYVHYEKTYNAIAASAHEDEIVVLKAIGLYYLCGEKIIKPTQERHEDILSVMTGFSVQKTRGILTKLTEEYQAIYYNSGNKTYRFYSGFSINDLRRKLVEDIKDLTPQLSDLLQHCRKNLVSYLDSDTVRAENFVEARRLNGEDWQFERQIFTIDEFQRKLSTERTVRGLSQRGLIAYFIGEYDEDLAAIERQAEAVLAEAPKAVQERVILAIPRRGTRDLARVMLMKNTLSKKSTSEKQEFGPALAELNKQFENQINSGLQEVFDSCTYTCRVIHKVPKASRKKLEIIVSEMLKELYVYVPSVESQDKLRTRSTKGSSIVSYASKHLWMNDLKLPFPDKGYETLIETVFVNRWKLLKSGKFHTVQVPQEPSIRQAWDTISQMTDIGERDRKTVEIKTIWEVLSDAPFGYNELTFTLLFAAWLTYHRAEVELSGGFGIPTKKNGVSNKSAPIHEWVQSGILEKPKDFVHIWIIQMGNKVVRFKPFDFDIPNSGVDYDRAVDLVSQNQVHQASGLLEPSKAQSLEKKARQLEQGIKAINDWLKPIHEAQNLLSRKLSPRAFDTLVKYYVPLEVSPPLVIKDGVVSVRATEEQSNVWRQTRQSLREKIETLVEETSTQAQVFETTEQGIALKTEVERQLDLLATIPDIPSRFSESLSATLDVIAQRIQSLNETQKTQETLEQIQNLYKTLGFNALQSQYIAVQDRIKELAEQSLAVQQNETYLRILTDVENQQDELIQKLDRWESRFASLSSLSEAYQLSQEVNREINRFDREESSQQVNLLISRIEEKILEQESEEAEEASLKNVVQQASQKCKAVSSLKNLIDAIQAYDDLSQLKLPSTQKVANPETYTCQLEALQLEARKAIEQKFEQLFQACDRDLKRREEYNQIKGYVTRSRKLIAEHAEFANLHERLQVAEDALEAKNTELQKRTEDDKLLREIQIFKLGMGNTIKRCEEILAQIEELRSQLHFTERYAASIERLVNAFQGKRAEYSLSLDELTSQLQGVETTKQLQQVRSELSKLEFVFKDSTEYSRYQSVDAQLKHLYEDLEHITNLETKGRDAQSIAAIDEILRAIADSQTHLHDPDRFQDKLHTLQASLHQRRQQLIDDLTQWQQDVEILSDSGKARKLRDRIASKANRYTGSDYEEPCDKLKTDLDFLTQLFALADIQRTETIEACQTEIEHLDNWRKGEPSLSERVEQCWQSIRQSLIQTQQSIRDRQCHAAQQWLSDLRSRASEVEAIADPSQKLSAAKQLIEEIRQTRNQHELFLADEQKDMLRGCQQQCEAIRNQDIASTIETSFQQLPKQERIKLYQRLSAYLETTTEGF